MEQIMYETRPIFLYDMEIEDVNERREKRLKFQSMTKAANFLGISTRTLHDKIKNRWYCYHRSTEKKYAARYADLKTLKSN